MGIQVRVCSPSIVAGGNLELSVSGLDLAGAFEVSVSLARVDQAYTTWAFATSTRCEVINRTAYIGPVEISDLPPGLFQLTQLSFAVPGVPDLPDRENQRIVFDPGHFGVCLVGIGEESSVRRTTEELMEDYRAILRYREADFLRGFGRSPDESDVHDYHALVFVKDCLLTCRMRLGQYEIIPFQGLGNADEVSLVKQFLANTEIGPIEVPALSGGGTVGEPVVVVHFPRLFALSVEEAGGRAEEEVRLLSNVLSIQRNSYGAVFATVIRDRSDGVAYHHFVHPHYSGNLAGGFISGEDSEVIKSRVAHASTDPRLRLYLALYTEAMKERRLDFAYFRLWNLLEGIARNEGLIGQSLCDWQGAVVVNKHGRPRVVQDAAEELVYELLRRALAPGVAERFAPGLQQGSIHEMVPVWYRHRNCTAHVGACLAQDPRVCDRNDRKFVACKKARDEVTEGIVPDSFDDGYLRILRDVAGQVLRWKCT